MCNGAIANLVDEVGAVLVHVAGLPMSVSVDMSICFLSTAKVNVRSLVLAVRPENYTYIGIVRNILCVSTYCKLLI